MTYNEAYQYVHSDSARLQIFNKAFDKLITQRSREQKDLVVDMTNLSLKSRRSLMQRFKKFIGLQVSPYHFGVCSRNLELKPTANQSTTFNNQGRESVYDQSDFWTMAIKADIEKKLPIGYAVQGELIGPKIQANHEKVTTLDYFIFDVFNITTGTYLLPQERRDFCTRWGLQHVPVINTEATPCNMTLEQLLQHVEGESMNPGTISEGRVYKHNTNPTISFKAISNKYLLKCEQ